MNPLFCESCEFVFKLFILTVAGPVLAAPSGIYIDSKTILAFCDNWILDNLLILNLNVFVSVTLNPVTASTATVWGDVVDSEELSFKSKSS